MNLKREKVNKSVFGLSPYHGGARRGSSTFWSCNIYRYRIPIVPMISRTDHVRYGIATG